MAIKRCEDELRKRIPEIARQGSVVSAESLTKDLEDKKRRRAKLIEAIETAGDIDSLTERLRDLEGLKLCEGSDHGTVIFSICGWVRINRRSTRGTVNATP